MYSNRKKSEISRVRDSYIKVFGSGIVILMEAAWLSGQSWGLECGRPGSNPRLGLLNEFVLGDPRGKFTTLCI